MYDYFWNYKKMNSNKDILEYYKEIKAAVNYLIESNCIIEVIKLLLSFFYTYLKVLEVEELRNDYNKIRIKFYKINSFSTSDNIFLLDTLYIIISHSNFRTNNNINKNELENKINNFLEQYHNKKHEYIEHINLTKLMLADDYSNIKLKFGTNKKIISYIKFSSLFKCCLASYYLGNLDETIKFIEEIENKDDTDLPFDASSLNVTQNILYGLKGNHSQAKYILNKCNINHKTDGYIRYINFKRQKIELLCYSGKTEKAKKKYKKLIKFLKNKEIYENIKYFEIFTLLDRIILKFFSVKYNFKKAKQLLKIIKKRVNKHQKK
jgi:hypothetical protein